MHQHKTFHFQNFKKIFSLPTSYKVFSGSVSNLPACFPPASFGVETSALLTARLLVRVFFNALLL